MDSKIPFKFLIFSFVTIFTISSLFAAPPLKTVAITQIADLPAADSVRQGIISALHDHGFKEGENLKIIYESAQGSPITATQIAKKFVSLHPDVLAPISTISTQSIVKADEGHEIPIVFAAVTNPVSAGIVPSLTHPGPYITGSTDEAPIKLQLALFKQILPKLKTLGIIYNPGDSSSTTPVNQTRKFAKEMNIDLVEATAFKTSDVPAAVQQLTSKHVDAIFVPLDNTVLSAMDSVLKIAFKHNVPVFTSDSDSVAQGAVASLGYSHFDTGYKAGEIISHILEGKKVFEHPIAYPYNTNIYINMKSAQLLNIIFPNDILKVAREI